jgi:hypothetical protein
MEPELFGELAFLGSNIGDWSFEGKTENAYYLAPGVALTDRVVSKGISPRSLDRSDFEWCAAPSHVVTVPSGGLTLARTALLRGKKTTTRDSSRTLQRVHNGKKVFTDGSCIYI